MSDLNRVVATGRLVKDVPVPTSTGKAEYVYFTVASNGYTKESTTFIKCQAWGNTAKYLSSYGKQGAFLYIDGELSTFKKQDGNYDWTVKVTKANLYSKLGEMQNATATTDGIPYPTEIDEDDVPF